MLRKRTKLERPARARLWFNSYAGNSKSLQVLRELGLDFRIIRKRNSRYRKRPGDVVVGWGVGNERVLNNLNMRPAQRKAVDKIETFRCFKEAGVSTVPWTENPEEACQWDSVVCRTVVNGHEGRGIVLWEKSSGLPLPRAPLYTRYISKESEWRVHVFRGEVIDIAKKVRRRDAPRGNDAFKIRNTANGYVFTHNFEDPCEDFPATIGRVAKDAINSLRLDFGAVDIIFNRKYNKFFALEVNTAPGLGNMTANTYKKYFERALNE
jgi:hypothetical protein